jgi:hypothetical protein
MRDNPYHLRREGTESPRMAENPIRCFINGRRGHSGIFPIYWPRRLGLRRKASLPHWGPLEGGLATCFASFSASRILTRNAVRQYTSIRRSLHYSNLTKKCVVKSLEVGSPPRMRNYRRIYRETPLRAPKYQLSIAYDALSQMARIMSAWSRGTRRR